VSEPFVIRVTIRRTDSGLYFTDSPDLPGLVITAATEEEIVDLTPKGIAGILRAMFEQEVSVIRARTGVALESAESDTWVAIPPYIAAQAAYMCD